VAVRDDGGVAGEGRVVGIPKFHSWVKCTMLLTNSDWMPNASSGLCIHLFIYIIYASLLSCILRCNMNHALFITKFGREIVHALPYWTASKTQFWSSVYNTWFLLDAFTISCLSSSRLISTNLGVSCAKGLAL